MFCSPRLPSKDQLLLLLLTALSLLSSSFVTAPLILAFPDIFNLNGCPGCLAASCLNASSSTDDSKGSISRPLIFTSIPAPVKSGFARDVAAACVTAALIALNGAGLSRRVALTSAWGEDMEMAVSSLVNCTFPVALPSGTEKLTSMTGERWLPLIVASIVAGPGTTNPAGHLAAGAAEGALCSSPPPLLVLLLSF